MSTPGCGALDGVRRRAPYAQHRNDGAEAHHG
jgi:hypothetical protein